MVPCAPVRRPSSVAEAVAALEGYLDGAMRSRIALNMRDGALWRPMKSEKGSDIPSLERVWNVMCEKDRQSPAACLWQLTMPWDAKQVQDDPGAAAIIASFPDSWDVSPEEWRLGGV